MIMPNPPAPSYELPPLGENPSTRGQGTTPGSFAQKGRVGTAWTFSSPVTPGMPPPAATVMDLPTGGDLNATRRAIIENATVPIGTVPIYSMIIGKKIEDLDWPMIEAELINQCEQGVDYMTIHAGVRRAHLPHVKNRLIGIVSRGGSLLAKWMIHHAAENPMYDRWDDICEILRRYDVTF